jgi:hypothetical protein
MAHLGYGKNEFGTTVSLHRCDTCDGEFTLCPAIPPDRVHRWENCLARECASYDPERDVDRLFDGDDDGQIVQAPPRGVA